MKPLVIDLIIYQGASFKQSWEIIQKDSGNPIDLTGYSANMQVRGKISDESPILDLSTENSGITIDITNDTTTLSLYAPASLTTAIVASKGVYDLELKDPSGDIYRLMQGSVSISKEVTR